MSEAEKFPPGWRLTSIGAETSECTERVGSYADPPTVLSSTKYYGLVPSNDFFRNRTVYSDNLSTYKRVSLNSFAYATNHLAEGSIGIQDRFSNACVSPIYTVFSCREGADPSYLYRVLKSPELVSKYKLHEQASVDRRGAVRYRDFSKISLVLPPLAEQQRIAEILDMVDEAIRSAETLIAKLEQARQGLLHDLLTRGIGIGKSTHLRDPHSHPEEFCNSALGPIPKVWRVARCDELCQYIVVGIVVKPTQYYVTEGVPILRSANVREDGIDMSDLKFMSGQNHKILKKSSVRPGDVLTVRTGYPGTSAVITDKVGEANCVDIIISRPADTVSPNFLALWINSPLGKGQVLAGQGGLAQQHFNIGQMKKLLVAVPGLAEQRVITEIFSSWEARVRTEIEKLEKLRALKQGLIDDLLTGRVRVGALR
jgi:restriction endonuclease S subunit